jgi:hypothetical protein
VRRKGYRGRLCDVGITLPCEVLCVLPVGVTSASRLACPGRCQQTCLITFISVSRVSRVSRVSKKSRDFLASRVSRVIRASRVTLAAHEVSLGDALPGIQVTLNKGH